MTRINANAGFAATTLNTTAAESEAVSDPKRAELIASIDEALAELDAIDSADLTDQYYQEKKRLSAMLKAEKAMLESGGAYGAGGAASAADVMPQDLEPMWNGIPVDGFSQNGEDMAVVAEDPAHYGEYAGTIEIPNSGRSGEPSKAAFQMTEDMSAVYAETRGRDIVVIVEYKDGTRESWVVKEGSVRPEPIIISARGLTDESGVTIDCSKVFRVNDGSYPAEAYAAQMMFVIGSEGNDTLIGSQSTDLIVGYAGDDTIDAMAGNDTVFGDEGYDVNTYTSGSFDPNYGGNDTIRGGAGRDFLYGEGGLDTSAASDKGEVVAEFDRAPMDDTLAEPPSADSFINSSGDWEAGESDENGMVVLTNTTGDGGEITIDMPEGYTMAYAEAASDGSMVITFVGEDETGSSVTFKLKIEDFFALADGRQDPASVVRLNFRGGTGDDIIDFSRIQTSSQVINISDENGGANIVLGAANSLLADGVDIDQLTTSQGVSDGKLTQLVEDGVFVGQKEDETNGYQARVENGQIVIDDDPSKENDPTVNLVAPSGYGKGYITEDNNAYFVVLVKGDAAGGEPKTIVYRVDKSTGLGWEDIIVSSKVGSSDDDAANNYVTVDLVPVSNTVDFDQDYAIGGGDGTDDLVFAAGGSRTTDEGSELVEMMATITSSDDANEVEETKQTTKAKESDETEETKEKEETKETEEKEETKETEEKNEGGDDEQP